MMRDLQQNSAHHISIRYTARPTKSHLESIQPAHSTWATACPGVLAVLPVEAELRSRPRPTPSTKVRWADAWRSAGDKAKARQTNGRATQGRCGQYLRGMVPGAAGRPDGWRGGFRTLTAKGSPGLQAWAGGHGL